VSQFHYPPTPPPLPPPPHHHHLDIYLYHFIDMTEKLIEIGRCNGMEINVKKKLK
jgi:hypothetical protein